MAQIFLLVHPENHQIAVQIAEGLKQAGYQPVFDFNPAMQPDAVLTLLSPNLLRDTVSHQIFQHLRAADVPLISVKVAPVPTHIKGIDATENLSDALDKIINRLHKHLIAPVPAANTAPQLPWQYGMLATIGVISLFVVGMLFISPELHSSASDALPTLSSLTLPTKDPAVPIVAVAEVTDAVELTPDITPEATEVVSYDDAEDSSDDEPIDAYFEPAPYEGVAPLAVSFWNDSYGNYTSCEWDFDGDGTVDSDLCAPDDFLYSEAGNYEITLTLYDENGDSSDYTDYVDVYVADEVEAEATAEAASMDDVALQPVTLIDRPVTALFRASPMEGLAPLTVNFTDLSRGNVVAHQWDLNGDGMPDSQGATASYTYTQRGDYIVTLTVLDDAGNQDTVDLTVYVYDESDNYEIPTDPPLARFSLSDVIGEAPLTVTFDNKSGGYITSYSWDFDSNGSVDSTARNPSYTFTQPGKYTVTLTVSNEKGESDNRRSVLTVKPAPAPEALFTANLFEGEAPLTVQFMDASEGDIRSYAWDFNGDGTVDSTESNPLYTFTDPGEYEVSLVVSGLGGAGEPAYEYIFVEEALPPDIDFTMSVDSGIAPLSVSFTSASDRDGLTYAWDFDSDGEVDSTDANPTYIFEAPGSYEVSLVATGKGGESERIYNTVYVSAALPVAQFVSSIQNGVAPLDVVFVDGSTGDITDYAWDFDGDGQTDSTESNPVYTYTESGIYQVSLIVSNQRGKSLAATQFIYVEAIVPEATDELTPAPEMTEAITQTPAPETTDEPAPAPEVTEAVTQTPAPETTDEPAPAPEVTEAVAGHNPPIPTDDMVEETESPESPTEPAGTGVAEVIHDPVVTTPAPEVTEAVEITPTTPAPVKTEAVEITLTTPAPVTTEAVEVTNSPPPTETPAPDNYDNEQDDDD